MSRGLCGSLLLLGLAWAGAHRALALTIADDTFLDASWSTSELIDTAGTAAFSTSQQHSIPVGGQSIGLGQIFTASSYDLVRGGAIESIDFSLDLRFIGGSLGTSQVGYQLLLVQAGSFYNALGTAGAVALGPGNGLPGPWSSHSFSALTATSFTNLQSSGPVHPDFSTLGSPLQFGYLTQNTSIDTAIATTSGIDNWSVTIHSRVPEPPAVALVAAALLILVLAGRAACAAPRSVEDSR
jgi:hypothetical protein